MSAQLALNDALVTGVWIFCSSIFEEISPIISNAVGISGMAAGLLVLCTGLALYEPICKRIGGEQASFSPAVNFALAGAGKGAIGHHSLRSAAQAIGGAIGAFVAIKVFPSAWQGKFGNYAHGVMPGNTLASGFLAEAILSFLLNISLLWAMETKFRTAGKLAPYIATIALIPAGAEYSGPFMNPAVAFSWYWNLQGASAWEHFVVFWAGCLIGSYIAGLVWRTFLQPDSKDKQLSQAAARSRRQDKSSHLNSKKATSQSHKTNDGDSSVSAGPPSTGVKAKKKV